MNLILEYFNKSDDNKELFVRLILSLGLTVTIFILSLLCVWIAAVMNVFGAFMVSAFFIIGLFVLGIIGCIAIFNNEFRDELIGKGEN